MQSLVPRIVQRPIPQIADTLLNSIPSLLRRIYLARGIRTEKELDLRLCHLLPPHNLDGVTAAANLLAYTIANKKHITVIGDYDADGATASALSVLILKALGGCKVDFLIPNRFTMGYGLAPELVEHAASNGSDLIMTVDSGII
ncbi:hypothetical protein TI05_18650 [Achromatium sp. WMS3]|nr:hypothetical protein TI05_18650 [Achromatium sp. WMS3]